MYARRSRNRGWESPSDGGVGEVSCVLSELLSSKEMQTEYCVLDVIFCGAMELWMGKHQVMVE